ncbi:3-deoxy-7-phosphoheptulonate synthase [Morganella psychrotolerans]|uniref:3-deoxy-7-phosphoheptulonate synthase class II n=1 Tax=Morganella psychrotolerans TaxID=368603 RepID=UPI000AF01CCB|nr:3-deoxy-7-phosphoheptulonate synthase class II [Morganella psychrotolerans]
MIKKQDGLQEWTPSSWMQFPAQQQPDYPEPESVRYVQQQLQAAPPLVSVSEIQSLTLALKQVSDGQGFILQCGDCAEAFSQCREDVLNDWTDTVSQMTTLLCGGLSQPVLKIGRIAGQYAKPRSSPDEARNGISLPSYRGDIINGHEFSVAQRIPDPQRMLGAYHRAAVTLNALHNNSLRQPGRSDTVFDPFYVSHEALLLPYDSALTRLNQADKLWYNGAAHTVWLGDRTSGPSEAHVEYLRGIANPVGIKCGPSMTAEKLGALLQRLNPQNKPGKIMLIVRLGVAHIREKLPLLLQAVAKLKSPVIWLTDPMHGNTRSTMSGLKTRDFATVCEEVRLFMQILRGQGVHPGGLHLEMTGRDVTECTGGLQRIADDDVGGRYESLCDPRLNRSQSAEIAGLTGQF